MQGQLTQKERMLLEDLKSEEELCVVKYRNYAQQAQCSQLSQLFSGIADVEQNHYDTVNQLLQSDGKSPSGQQGQGGGQKQGQGGQKQGQQSGGQASQGMKSGQAGGQMNQAAGQINLSQAGSNSGSGSDKYLLQDMLTIEKHVSSAYNTSIFEMTQPNVKQALQHIQKEEQDHGDQLYQYMSSHGMYQAQ